VFSTQPGRTKTWPTASQKQISGLHSINKEIDTSASNSQDSATTPATYYYDYFSIQSLDYDSHPLQFSEFVIEAAYSRSKSTQSSYAGCAFSPTAIKK